MKLFYSQIFSLQNSEYKIDFDSLNECDPLLITNYISQKIKNNDIILEIDCGIGNYTNQV